MIASNLTNPANLTSPMQASLFYTASCKAGVTIIDVAMKSSEFWWECGY